MALSLIMGVLTMLVSSGVVAPEASAAPGDPTGCGYATGSPGVYADTICWIDFSGYDEAQVTSPAGQPFEITLEGGFTATFNLKTRSIPGWPYQRALAYTAPSMVGYGAFSGLYSSTPGRPILWNILNTSPGIGSGISWTLDGINVTGPDGQPVSDYKFVTGDAEASATGENVRFSSDSPLDHLESLILPGSNRGCFLANTTGVGTTQVSCDGVGGANPSQPAFSNILFASQSPTVISQEIRSNSRNGGVFGFMMSKVELTKNVESRAKPSDSFNLSVTSGASSLSSGSTGTADTGTTGQTTVLAGSTVTLEETAEGETNLAEYDTTWACTRNGVAAPELNPSDGSTSLDLLPGDIGSGDFIQCAINNSVKPRVLEVVKTSNADSAARPGDSVTYQIVATNTGERDYTVEDPAVVFDDLSGVLDDASYNGDVAADRPGSVSFVSPLVGWAGALPVGESVVLTYSVILGAGGDGTVRNVAWAPEDPEDPVTPGCDPPVDGVDPVTGEPCATTTALLPKLSVVKSADRSDLPAVGEVVEYSVVVSNPGPGAYTAGAPASMTDDLSDVFDDADLVPGSVSATVGSASVTGDELSWSGPLAAGESATITYSVSYTGAGDQVLLNLACVPAGEVAPGQLPCDFVQIPGSGLSQWKQVVSSDSPAVAGSVLTYTLFFKNHGTGPATVDAVDDLSHVADDADVTTEPTASAGLAAVRTGDQIAIGGSVPAGGTSSVTYKVTVKADGDRGDDVAANFLLDPGVDPPTDPVCEPTNETRPDCTVTNIAAVTYVKLGRPEFPGQ